MEKVKRRRSRLWLVPLIVLILICAAAAVLTFRVGLSVVHRDTSAKPCAAGYGIYLRGQSSQLAGDPLLSGGEPVTDPDVTALVSSGGVETLTGGYIPITYFCQADEQWAEKPFGTDTIGPYGCGPTAMAMAVSSMTEWTVTPLEMAQRAVELGCWSRGHGSYHSITGIIAEDFGLVCESLQPNDVNSIFDALISGKLLVALMGPGHFTDGGHFILLRGATLSGDILVADPNSRDRSLTAWDPETIISELSTATDYGAPLWALSKPDK